MRKKRVKNLVWSILLLGMGLVASINSNNNPLMLIERLISPLSFASGSFYHYNIILLTMVYFGLKNLFLYLKLDDIAKNKVYMITAIVLFSVLLPKGIYALDTGMKHWSKDLNGMTFDYENTIVRVLETDEDHVYVLEFRLLFENVSSVDQSFDIQVLLPDRLKEALNQTQILLKPDTEDDMYSVSNKSEGYIFKSIRFTSEKDFDYFKNFSDEITYTLTNGDDFAEFGKRYYFQ